MSGRAPDEAHSAENDALAEALGRHLFLRSDWPDLKSRCTCGHEYDNPNASEGYSHPQHVAETLVAAGYTRPLPLVEKVHDVGGRVHNHPPYRPVCNEREVDGQLRGACLNDDGSSVLPPGSRDTDA